VDVSVDIRPPESGDDPVVGLVDAAMACHGGGMARRQDDLTEVGWDHFDVELADGCAPDHFVAIDNSVLDF
jgi:hypothetical protein